VAIAVFASIGMVFVQLQAELERNRQAWATAIIVLLTIFLGLIWFLFLSRLRWRTRGFGVGLLAVVVFGLSRLVQIDGAVDGRGLPKLVWRWNAPRPAVLNAALPALGSAPFTPVAGLADVPQFFGPKRDGIVRDAELARDWKVTPPKELWRQPIGGGWSAFAVVGGRAYTQEQRGEDEAVTCYDLLTGQLLWMHNSSARFFQWQGGEGPRATPTVYRGSVFAYGGTGLLVCLDAITGQQRWSRDVLKENSLENLTWGTSASPLVFDETVVITGAAANGPTVLAYHCTTGEPLWKSGTDKASYASPILATLAGRRVVLSVNAATVTAHDPITGGVLLDFRWTDDKWPKAAQPVVLPGDRIFVSAGYGMGALLLAIEATPDLRLTATQLWKSIRMKTQFNSVALRDGFLYGLDDGLLACVDAATGERKWKDGRYGSGQSLLVDDLILVQSEPGPVILAAARPEGFEELGRLAALSSKTWNHPTLAGRYLLVRNDREAVCYELPMRSREHRVLGPAENVVRGE
jgi:outer membrane protein assembly factor BamB